MEIEIGLDYAVVRSSSYYDEAVVHLFRTEEEAIKFLRDSFNEELRESIEKERAPHIASEHSVDWRRARIDFRWEGMEGEKDIVDTVEMRLTYVYDDEDPREFAHFCVEGGF